MPQPRPRNAGPSFLHSDRVLARAAKPFVRFLQIEAAGGLLLVVATVAALLWANSPWAGSYQAMWSSRIGVDIGAYRFEEDLRHVVNDLLMAVFFFVVGMEIKRELVAGELHDRRAVALPAMAAVGGMVVPALLYTALNVGGDGAAGWGIPMATDIAFALGIVALLGSRVPPSLKVLLLTLAIVDDIGAVAVIAIFYSDGIEPGFLLVAFGLATLLAVMHRAQVTFAPSFILVAAALWWSVYESGVHATIAGVVLGLLTPAALVRPEQRAEESDAATTSSSSGSVSACDHLIGALHPWTGYVIVPLFALANAGVVVSVDAVTEPSTVLAGVAVALVLGKLVGVASFSWLAVRLGFGRLPDGVRWTQILGIAAVAGIGFTVSLFISGLAFDAPALQDDAKMGTLIAAVIAAILGGSILHVAGRTRTAPTSTGAPRRRRHSSSDRGDAEAFSLIAPDRRRPPPGNCPS